ncbi:hypothetical protein [Novosphingobium sp. FKTRR1]|uniref:hypothetical protein n=1 Tax=Novosphingobium sp. FKTRR1 TaxID=2879118 RepID=UPI001CF026CC|nr:hypothetical protein [Novosphingobium sp. FKTRR1]
MTIEEHTEATLKPCPFCGSALGIRRSVNPYGRCNTDGCWMHDRKIIVPIDDGMQIEQWNTRDQAAWNEGYNAGALAMRDAGEGAVEHCIPKPAGYATSHTNSMRVIGYDCLSAIRAIDPASLRSE